MSYLPSFETVDAGVNVDGIGAKHRQCAHVHQVKHAQLENGAVPLMVHVQSKGRRMRRKGGETSRKVESEEKILEQCIARQKPPVCFTRFYTLF